MNLKFEYYVVYKMLVQLWALSDLDNGFSPFTTIQIVRSYISALAHCRKL